VSSCPRGGSEPVPTTRRHLDKSSKETLCGTVGVGGRKGKTGEEEVNNLLPTPGNSFGATHPDKKKKGGKGGDASTLKKETGKREKKGRR